MYVRGRKSKRNQFRKFSAVYVRERKRETDRQRDRQRQRQREGRVKGRVKERRESVFVGVYLRN